MDWGAIPDGSLVIFDEAQYFFPGRGPSVGAPVHVKFLNTHRHAGFDIWLITQHPKNLDNAVRRLVDKHKHIRRVFGWGRAVIYEWPHSEDGLQGLKKAVMTTWSYPRKSFEFYKSAEIHTKQTFKKPWWIWVPIAMIPVAIWAAPKLWELVWNLKDGKGVVQSKPGTPVAPKPPTPQPLVAAPPPPTPMPPVVPASAPVAAPKFAGCVAMRGVCKCIDVAGDTMPKDAEFCADSVGANRPAKLAEIPPSLQEYHPKPRPPAWGGWAPDYGPKRTGAVVADVLAAYR